MKTCPDQEEFPLKTCLDCKQCCPSKKHRTLRCKEGLWRNDQTKEIIIKLMAREIRRSGYHIEHRTIFQDAKYCPLSKINSML